MTMVPEAWQNDTLMNSEKKSFYRWSACAMEPWDGPGKLMPEATDHSALSVYLK